MTEDGRVEYKAKFTENIPKAVVAFSNTKGGRVFVGIDDDGNIFGLENPDETARRCVQSLHDDIHPDVTPTTIIDILKLNGKDIVEIVVNEGTDKPYYLREKGLRAEGVYIRRGPSSVQVTESQFNEMIKRVRSKTFESSTSFRQDLSFAYAESIFNDAGIAFDDTHKHILGVKDSEGYTNLGFLLSDQCDFQIKAAVLSDKGRTGFKDRMEISGSVLRQFDEIMNFVKRNCRTSSLISGMKREDHTDYPTEAVREVILNAIIHRDYRSSGYTLLSIYGDCIEIASPGSLPEDIPIDDLLKGSSFPRNPMLASIFYRLGLVESYGSGIPRVMYLYNNNEKKPKIEVSSAMFRITLYPLKKSASEESTQILTRRDIEKMLGISRSTATSIIKEKLKKGELVKEGQGKNTRYRIVLQEKS